MRLDAVLAADHVRVPGAAGSPGERAVPVPAIRDADPGATPPEIRTVSGETLFLPVGQRADLEAFCTAHGIARRCRADVWGDLLERFLDTEFTPEQHAATLARLGQAGLEADEVAAIRDRVAPMVRVYNAVHQDWHHLGLADLLDAADADWIPERERIAPADRAAFRDWAMRIADRGRACPPEA
ncbi:hypothetical protein ACIA8O_04325 [Kitasatospora sp. NPDC051853]|uniref:hypothetical protein n=1 Tax=Kitasatospora sp. NPDC051853 TaxID=3364058 RepID=UPI00379CC0BD